MTKETGPMTASDGAPVVFIDTETLGLDPDHNPVWEVGMILPNGGECQLQVAVTPRQIALAHPKALEISGFHERYDPHRAFSPGRIANCLSTWIPQGAHLAGAVVSFDEERLRRLLWAHGRSVPWHYHTIDVEALAVGYLAGTGGAKERIEPPWDSETLSRMVGVDPDQFERHTALGDARWAKAIYEAVME